MSDKVPIRKVLKISFLTLAGTGLLLILSCGGCFYWGYGRVQEAETSAEAFLSHLAAGRVDEAYGETHSAFKEGVSPERFSELLEKYPLLAAHTGRDRGPWKVVSTPKGVVVHLHYKLTGQNDPVTVDLTLMQQEGWRVYALRLP